MKVRGRLSYVYGPHAYLSFEVNPRRILASLLLFSRSEDTHQADQVTTDQFCPLHQHDVRSTFSSYTPPQLHP